MGLLSRFMAKKKDFYLPLGLVKDKRKARKAAILHKIGLRWY